MAEALREIDKNLIIHTDKEIGIEDGQQISGHELPLLADTQNRYQNRCFLASWEGSDKKWLFSEDKWAAEGALGRFDGGRGCRGRRRIQP